MTLPIFTHDPNAPFWQRHIHEYVAVEVYPVRDIARDTPEDFSPGETCFEVCPCEQAEYWSVYGRMVGGYLEFLGEDFASKAEAQRFAAVLRWRFAHLQPETFNSLP